MTFAAGERDSGPHHSTPSEDGITLALSAWLIGGIFLDGYAHVYVIDTTTEDFFTPWHAIFYAGFAALAGWIGWVGYRRRRPGGSILDWFPDSYRWSVIGLAIFAIGGIGDGIWHTIFGVEVGIDALLSPTHLVLMVGGLLLLWTPVRASAARNDRSGLLALGSATLVISLLVFLVQYLWLIPFTWFAHQPFDAASGQGYGTVQTFLGGAMVTTAVLLGPLLLITRRWDLPVGTTALAWSVAAGLESLAFSQRFWPIVLVAVGGLVHDLVRSGADRGGFGRAAAGFAGPASLFMAYLIYARAEGPLGWPPEIWGGLVVMAGFAGLALVLIQDSGGQRSGPLLAGSDTDDRMISGRSKAVTAGGSPS